MLKSDRGNLRTVHMAVRWIMFVLVFVFQLAPAVVHANPTGGEVVAGQAGISNSGNTTTINQASQTAVINWQDFSIAGGEVTKFVQPNASAAVLNKVIGNNVSQIYGTLQANGQVFLVNQSGVFVGAGGVINTAGFVASTLDLDTDTFMKGGDMKFAGNSQASIVNLGTINGTNGVFLISQKIENNGKISASHGEAGLAAGSEVLLKQSGDERTSVLVGSSASGTGISNKGEIAAAVATMKATGSMYSVAVNNEGIVRAQGVNMSGGKVRLTGSGGTVINSGTLSAKKSNETGGTVIVEGKNVGLINNSVVDVSGKKGGGTALIGGDFQGKNPDVINAEKTYVGQNAVIKADAQESGDGGKIVVWSDNSTQFYGSASAKSGSQSGNGGFAEISGKGYLNFAGKADVSSAHGQGGTILFDPLNITITNTADANTAGFDVGTNDLSELFADDAGLNSNFDVTAVTGSFAGITAGSTIILQATNDITVSAAFDLATATGSANNSLVLQAGNDITINANLSATGTGTLTLSADDNGSNGAGVVALGAGITISTANQAINLTAANLFFNATGAINAGTGTVTLTATNNRTIGLNAGADFILTTNTLQNTTAGTLVVNSTAAATTAITVVGITAANSNNVGTVILNASGAGGDIIFQSVDSTFNALTAVANDQVNVNAAVSTDTGALNLTGQATTGSVNIGGTLTGQTGVTLVGNNIAITNDVNVNNAGSTIAVRQFTNGTLINVGGADAAGTLGLSSAEIARLNNTGTAGANVIIGSTNAGALTVSAALNSLDANVDVLRLSTGATLAVNNAITLAAGQDLILEANGAITQAAAIDARGLATAGTGTATLNTATNTFSRFASSSSNNVSVTSDTDVNIQAVGNINSVNIGANALTISLVGAGDNLTQTASLSSGNLTVSTVAGGDVILNTNANNAVTGTVTVTAGAGDFLFDNTTTTQLGNITAFALTVESDNAISQAGGTTLNVDDDANFRTVNNNQSITLANSNNLIGDSAGDTIIFTTAGTTGNVSLTNNGTIRFGTSLINGSLTAIQENGVAGLITQEAGSTLQVTGAASFDNNTLLLAGDVTIRNDNAGGTVFGPGDSVVGGDLNLTSAGPVTQTGAVKVAGNFNATGGNVTFDNAGNVFGGTFTTPDGSIFLSRVGDVNINAELGGAVTTGAGSLTVIALRSGEQFGVGANQPGDGILLNQAGNSFGGGLVVNTGAPVINTVNALTNNITQSNNISVGGTATFRAVQSAAVQTPNGNITLNAGGTNSLTGPIQFSGNNVLLANSTTTNLAASTVAGNFAVTSVGNISNSGILNVTGTSSFTGTTAGNLITLNQANQLTGAVSFTKTGAGNVILNNNQATLLGNVSTGGGDFSVTSNGNLTQLAGTSIVMTTAGNLNVTNTTGNAVLTEANNNILNLGNVASANFSYYDLNGYNITGTIVDTGFTDLGTTTGNVVQTAGTITTNGLLLTRNGAALGNFTINQAGNAITTLAAQQTAGGSSNITVVNNGSFAIGTVNAVSGITAGAGNVTLTSATGSITRAGTSAINMNGGALVLTADTGVGTSGTPIFTTGNHLLSGSAVTSGGYFVQNNTSGNVTINGITAPNGAITVNNTAGTLTVTSAVDASTTATLQSSGAMTINSLVEGANVVIDAATTLAQNANIGTTGTTATVSISNGGAFTRTGGVVNGDTSVTLSGAGNVGTAGAAVRSNTLRVILNKAVSGDTILTNTADADLEGTNVGDLTFTTTGGNININANNLAGSATSDFELIAAVQIINNGGFIDLNGGNLRMSAGQVGAAVNMEVRDVLTLAGTANAGAFNVNNAYNTPALTGRTLTIGSVTGLTGTVNGITAVNALTINQAAQNFLVVSNTAAANDVQSTAGSVSLVVAPSPAGTSGLTINSGAAVRSGAGNGGTITVLGGTTNNGIVSAGAGTTVLLDGGQATLVVTGTQNYTGSVNFQANDDIIINGIINQTGSGAVMQFLADFNNDGAGGFLLTDDGNAANGIFNTTGGAGSSIVIAGSNLIDNTFGGGIYGGSIGNGVVLDKAVGNAVSIVNNGLVSLTSKDVPNTATNDIILDGAINAGGATAQIDLISDAGISMSKSVTSGGIINVTNSELFARTAVGAQLNAGTNINFAGIGDLGTAGTRLLTNAALLNFDSAGNTKTAADAFIQEFNAVAIEGSLDEMDIIAGNTITDTANKLIVNTARLTATSGSIILDTGHAVQTFDGVSALGGSFTYIGDGDTNLLLTDTVQANAGSGIITINLADPAGAVDRSFTQDSTSIIAGNQVNIVTGTASLNAFIRRAVAASTQNVSTTITTEGDAATTVVTSGASSLISTDLLTVNGVGNVGTSLLNGLHTDADALVFNKSTGDLYVFEDNSVAGNVVSAMSVSGTLGTTTAGTLNVSASGTTQTANLNLGTINANNGSNVHLIATSNTQNAQILRTSGAINMSGGELLLSGRQGVGQKASPIVTNGSYFLAGGNNGTSGGFYIRNDGTGDITVSDIAAFTPASLGATQTFNGVVQASTGNTGAVDGDRNIRIVNNDGSILVGDRIQTTLNNQQVLLIANNPGGRILQADAGGVINMGSTVGTVGGASQLYLLADSGIGAVDNALRTNGTFTLAASSTNDSGGGIGGVYLVNVGTATQANAVSAGGTITIGSVTEAGGSTFVAINGVTTSSPSADADIRIRNNGAAGSNIVVDNLVQASVGTGANTVALIASNGAILQGAGLTGRIVSEGDGVNPGEVLLIANQGIGTLASALRVNGNYNLAVANTDSVEAVNQGFPDLAGVLGAGAATGNINILNSASGPLTGLGHITVTSVNDLFTAGGTDVNTYAGTVFGGLNTADTAASGAIRITNTNTGVDNGDIIVNETLVLTTGQTFGTAFINLVAADDVLIGSTTQTSFSQVVTLNGAITLTASNGNDVVNDADVADGIVIVGDVNNVTAVQSFGTAGVITLSAITDAHADVRVHSALIQAGGTIAGNGIIISANDDILLGDANQETLSLIQTVNAGISLTATNTSTIASGTDGVDGILVQASNNALNGLIDDVYVNAQGANGAMTITATANNGVLTVNGGADNNGQARLRSDTSMAVDVDLARLNGGTGNAGIAQLVAGTTQTVFVRNTGNNAVALDINGGAGNNAQAGLYAAGAQTVRAFRGDITLDAGNGNNSRSEIETTVGNQIVSIGLDNTGTAIVGATGDLLMNGGIGAGTNSRALISMLDGTASQTIRVVDNITLLGGVSNNNDAVIRSSNTQSVTGGNALTTNNITLTGGTGTNAQARISADNTQTVTAILGNVALTGGDGNGSNASIRLNDGKNGTQGVFVQNGDLILFGNQAGSDADASIDMLDIGSSQTIRVGINSVGTTTGSGVLVGVAGTGANSSAAITSSGTQNVQVIARAFNPVTEFGGALSGDVGTIYDFTGNLGIGLRGGGGLNSSAGFVAVNQQDVTVTGGDVQLLAGSGDNALAGIQVTGIGNQTVTVQTSGNVFINGGSGTGASAGIYNIGTDADTQTVSVQNGTLTALGGSGNNSLAGIVHFGNGLQSVVTSATIRLLGGSADNTTAGISAEGISDQTVTVTGTGDIIIGGGSGNAADAFINAVGLGNSTMTQLVTVTNGNLLVTGGTNATEAGDAFIQADSTASTQTINVGTTLANSGTIVVTGGTGLNGDAFIDAFGNQNVTVRGALQATNALVITGGTGNDSQAFISKQGDDTDSQNITVVLGNAILTGGNGLDSDASIVGNGVVQNITITSGNMDVTANQDAGANDSDAFIQATNTAGTQTIIVSGVGAGTLDLLGGAGVNERAQILGNGVQAITVANGLTVTGGSNTDSTADITKAGDAADTQTITVTNNNFDILGGTGVNANASVSSNGVTQAITVSNGALRVQGDQTNAATANAGALISATNTAAVQTIDVTNGGILVRGGVGTTENAVIQMTGTSGRQSIHAITNGDFVVEGGNGSTSIALILSNGLNGGANQEAQRIVIDAGQLIVRANQSAAFSNSGASIIQDNTGAASQFIQVDGLASGDPADGTMSVLGGAGFSENALVSSNGNVAQTLLIARGLTLLGGTGTSSSAGILSTGTNQAQSVTVTTGDTTLTGGTGNDTFAFIDQTQANGTQVITISGTSALSDLVLTGGNGNNADARITASGITQTILVSNGDMDVTANQDAVGSNSDAFVQATNNASTQTITVAGVGAGTLDLLGGAGATELARILGNGIQLITVANGLTVTGGSGTSSSAEITKAGDAADTQTIVVTNGDFDILGGTGVNADATVQSNGVTQSITVSNGEFSVLADQTNAASSGAGALVSATNTNAVQTIDVTNGGIRILGGAGSTETAIVQMSGNNGRQTIHAITDGDFVVGGGNGATSFAQILSNGLNGGVGQEAQRIVVDAGQLIVRGNQNNAANDSSASIIQNNGGAASQFIQVSGTTGTDGTASVLGGAGVNEFAFISSNGNVAQTLLIARGLTATGGAGNDSRAEILASGTNQVQTVTVTTGNASLTGGTGNASGALINQTDANGTQAITVSGTSALSNLALTGGNGVDSDARISSGGVTQSVTVSNGNLAVTANQDAANASSDASIQATNTASTQTIIVSGVGAGTMSLLGGAGTSEVAQILGNGIQGITVANGLSVTGGSGANSTASIDKAGDAADTQTIIVTAGNFGVRGGTGANATAGVNSNGTTQTITVSNGALTVLGDNDAGAGATNAGGLAQIASTGAAALQTINVTNGGITVSGGLGANDSGQILTTAAGSTQTINTLTAGAITVNGGSAANAFGAITAAGIQDIDSVVAINVNGGTAAGAFGAIDKTNVGTQDLNAGTTINLNDGTGALARVSHTGGGAQTIVSVGTTNLTGDSGFEALILSTGTTQLTNNGGTWTNVANVTTTNTLTVTNTGAIIVDELTGAVTTTGMVTADTLVFTGGNTAGATVASTGNTASDSTRLRTTVNTINFNGVGNKIVNLRETNTVGVQGLVGAVNMVAGGTISNAAADLAATNATLRATAGDINLNNAANSVNTFNGLISDAGSIVYNGDSGTTFANRAISQDIVAGAGVFAQNDITVNLSAGTMTVTAGQILSNAGDMNYTAVGGIALGGGTKVAQTAPGAGDGLVTTLDGTQTYNNAVVLNSDYLISASGAADDITFNSTINGPGGLGIGSTPNFNADIGTTTPLAYMFLNSPANSNFNAGGTTAVINGDFQNINGGTVNIIGNWVIFVDNGVVGPGPGIFAGGTVNVTGSLAIYAPNPASISGTGFDTAETFSAWNGGVNGQPVIFTLGASGIFYKAPPPTDDIKDKKNKRKDIEADYTVSYEEGVNAGTMVSVSGVPLAEPSADKTRVGGLLTTSYGVNSAQSINSFYFGREVQAPIQLETDKLIDGKVSPDQITSPNRN